MSKSKSLTLKLKILLYFLSSLFTNPVLAQLPLELKFLNQIKQAALYPGPLRIFVFDYDGNIAPMKGPGAGAIRVFKWSEPSSPFYSPLASTSPEWIDIPMEDWDRGVSKGLDIYKNVPLKTLVGTYVNSGRGIRDHGNSFEDRLITLSNGEKINPRDYYLDSKESYFHFRTGKTTSEGEISEPLVESTQKIIQNKNFGPMFPLFRVTTHPDFPGMTMVLTVRGNQGIEWSKSIGNYVEAGELNPEASVQRVFAISNPNLPQHDPSSTKLYARYDASPESMKNTILDYLIENVLKRRVDRTHGKNPESNVLAFIEDGLSLNAKAQQLFEEKIRGFQHTLKGELNDPPLKIILANTAPLKSYAPSAFERRQNPQALYMDGDHLASISVFDSKFVERNLPFVQKQNHKSYEDIMIAVLKNAFGINQKTASQILYEGASCKLLLGGKP